MRKLSISLVFLFFSVSLFAQTYLDVQPGYGTLNAAITAHQGNVIYRLQAGQWYGLNGVIENNGFTLNIVGTIPVSGQMPAEIQTGTNPDGTVLPNLFNLLDDFTIKNVFIVNADENNSIGQGVFVSQTKNPIRVVIDSITCDPVASGLFINFNSPNPKFYLTNSLFLRMGSLNGANDNHFLQVAGAPNTGFDTLYIENNTFMSTGMSMGQGPSFNADSENFVWINHNTFIFHKSQLLWMWHMNSYFVTNNLFFDFSTQPWDYDWNAFFPDGNPNIGMPQSKFALVNQDTVSYDSRNGTLLSQRKLFVEYNSFYTDPRIYAYTTYWASTHTKNNDGVTPLANSYIMHLMYPPDSANVNREAQMSNDKTHFPNFYEGNYFDNFIGSNPPNTDPNWTDPKIYAIQDSLVAWTLPAAELNSWGFDANKVNPQPNQAPNWFWCLDTVYNYGNPVVWPRLNASYTNSIMLTASIEGLPLGDLNWFPAQKTIWQKNQTAIMAHILSENTSVINITSVKQENNETPANFSLSQNYPNPFNPSTEIKYSIPQSGIVALSVYNMLGQKVATLVNQEQKSGNYIVNFDASKLASGVYMYRIQSGDFSLAKKMELLK